MRGLFELIVRPLHISPNLFSAITGANYVQIGGYNGTSDSLEIFNNSNDRDIQIIVEILNLDRVGNEQHTISEMRATCSRGTPLNWTLEVGSIQGGVTSIKNQHGFSQLENDKYQVNLSGEVFEFEPLFEVIRSFRDAKYYGAFRNPLNQGAGQHYDLMIGTGFNDLWNAWKTSGNKAQARAIGNITEEIRRLFEFDQLEIIASTSLKTLLVTINGQQYRLGELGSGISQFIMALGNAATAKPTLILVDEPETNLHPALQIDFLLTLAQHASVGCLFSTHSVGLARSVAQPIYSLRKGKNGPTLRLFETTSSYTEFLGELSFSTFKDMGCDRILLVEGVNDVKTAQQLLRLFGKEHSTVILPLGGDQLVRGDRDFELQELSRLSNRIYALVDSERHSEDAPPAKRRLQFQESCKKLGFVTCITRRRAIENYFPQHAVQAALGSSREALTSYGRLDEHPNGWRKSENWKIAHYMGKADLASTDVGTFLEKM
jgi:energy-coupling factor transporter ATP-binding protein EcfA2